MPRRCWCRNPPRGQPLRGSSGGSSGAISGGRLQERCCLVLVWMCGSAGMASAARAASSFCRSRLGAPVSHCGEQQQQQQVGAWTYLTRPIYHRQLPTWQRTGCGWHRSALQPINGHHHRVASHSRCAVREGGSHSQVRLQQPSGVQESSGCCCHRCRRRRCCSCSVSKQFWNVIMSPVGKRHQCKMTPALAAACHSAVLFHCSVHACVRAQLGGRAAGFPAPYTHMFWWLFGVCC
ncbi:hypothetical protein JKP88DRAFT_222552 [Tribonema minus]|uniref:Uncharacterized protein n=1 Tax=Tribonema minus TaxID=303371 RepID=A0A835Z1B1_9STRA|nr:hypothetical protein JKP88DRAFT_222552 [Tribonema minus]